jgi:transposase-like protein
MDALSCVRKQIEQADSDLLREMVKLFCERAMAEEADAICGAPHGERSEERPPAERVLRRDGLTP